MTLPITTRYVRVEAPTTDSGDAYDNPAYETLVDSTPGHLSGPGGSNDGDRFVEIDAIIYVNDVVPIPNGARITDLSDGKVYAVKWATLVIGLGLDHRKCGVVETSGAR